VTASKNDEEPPSLAEDKDHYRLLQIDPDAPREVIVEAYWYVVQKLLASRTSKQSVERQMKAINVAYAVLLNSRRRRAYDATLARVQELRQARAEAKAAQQPPPPPPLLIRLLYGPPPPPPPPPRPDYYALLAVDPQAEAPLIARAHALMRCHRSEGNGAIVRAAARLAELDEAYSVLLDEEQRAAYDLWLAGAAEDAARSAEAAAIMEERLAAEAEAQPAAWPQGPQAVRTNVVLQLVGRAALATGRFLRGCAVLVASAIRLAVVWALTQGKRAALAIAQAARGLAAQLGERRARERAPSSADLLDQRLLRDSVPQQLRRAPSEGKEKPGRARLHITEASGKADIVGVGDKPITLGSDPCSEVFLEADDGLVAAAHAQIWFAGGHFAIRSLSPRHVTRVGGNNVNWAMLDDGDEIEIGRCRIRFETMHPSGTTPDFLSARPSPR
jgi:curved DNA-binding protein CbpA